MYWEESAEAVLRRVPAFARTIVRQKIEEHAAAKGCSKVSLSVVEEADRALITSSPSSSGNAVRNSQSTSDRHPSDDRAGIRSKHYNLGICSVKSGCPNRVMNPTRLMQRLAETIEASGYSEFMETRSLGPNIRHKTFTVSLAGCPHECSQPLVRDFGVIGRSFVIREYGEGPESICTECGDCVDSCREDALQLIGGEPDIDYAGCIGCGDCVRACDKNLLVGERSGYTVVIGGRLGRHPQFAQEVMLLGSEDEVDASLRICLKRYMTDSEEGERFSDFLNRVGVESLRQSIEEGMREAREQTCGACNECECCQ